MESEKKVKLQDIFFNEIRKRRIQVIIYLTTGAKLTGKIKGFDSHSILLEGDKGDVLVFKNAISSIMSSDGKFALDWKVK